MGCSNSQETLETHLFICKLNKQDIHLQREELLREYQLITGEVLNRKKIPDYIDHQKMKEKRLEREIREKGEKEEEERKKREEEQKEQESLRKREEEGEILEDVLGDYV